MAKETLEDVKALLEAALKENAEKDALIAELSSKISAQEQSTGATDLDQYKGKYLETETGAVFGLKVLNEDQVREKKTHHVKNATHFADYTREEFKARFEKI